MTDRLARPAVSARIPVAVAIGVASALLFLGERLRSPGAHSDFGQAWFGARALLAGADPYGLVGPGKVFEWPWPLLYPGTAVVLAMPFAMFRETFAAMAFVGVSAGLLAYAVTDDGWYRLPLFLSSSFVIAARAAQWSPLTTAALCLPAMAWVFAAKPNLGLMLLAFAKSSRPVIIAALGGIVLLAVSLTLLPHWPVSWIRNISRVDQFTIPITRWGGPFVLLALLRWKRPEARLIVALACIPQTAYWYETLPLLLVPATFRESLILSFSSALGFLLERALVGNQPDVAFHDVGSLLIAFVYLPATIMVLRRPNTSRIPTGTAASTHTLNYGHETDPTLGSGGRSG